MGVVCDGVSNCAVFKVQGKLDSIHCEFWMFEIHFSCFSLLVVYWRELRTIGFFEKQLLKNISATLTVQRHYYFFIVFLF